ELVANGRFKNRRFLPVCGQSEFPVLHCEAIGSLKFGTRIFPGILREIFRGGFYRFKFHKNLGRTVLDSQRGADAPVLQTIKSDCRAGRGHEMICVARFETCAEATRSEEHTSELQSPDHLVCRLLLEKKNI